MIKAAVYTGSRNLYPAMVTAAKSLLANSDVDKIYLLIEDDEIPYDIPECVETINVSEQKFFQEDGPNMKSGYTYLAMMRAALAYVFPDLDVILSLDVDTIVDKDISDLWSLPLDDYYFAAAKEEHRSYEGLFYTNTGVALYNLKKLRDGKADEVIFALNHQRFTWVEQDAFNYLCQGRILEMPSRYNVNTWTAPTEEKRILHYAGISMDVWQTFPEYLKYRDLPFPGTKKESMKIFIAVPTFETIYPDTFKSIYGLDPAGNQLVFDFVRGYDCATARNRIARQAIAENADYVLMVDSDMVLPSDTIAHMLEDSKDICLGVYANREGGAYNGNMCIYKLGEFNYSTKYLISEVNEMLRQGETKVKVHGGGMGCALIRTDVFKRIKYPWFDWVNYENDTVLSEDLYFCEQCAKNGITVYADMRVKCGHVFRQVQWPE